MNRISWVHRGNELMSDFRNFKCILILGSLALLISASVGGCATGITREELLKEMQGENPPLVVDVRSQGEYDKDHVPGALHIPFYSVGSGLNDIGYSIKDPVVLYCEHGPRAGIAGVSLFLSGYDRVYFLEGQMKGWRKNDFPIEIIIQQPHKGI